MTRFLPPQPNLEHLKHEAKTLHKAHQQRQPDVCPVLRQAHRFLHASDEEIFSTDVSLTECQFVLAQEYGFSGWQALRRTVQGLYANADYHSAADVDAILLPDIPPGLGKHDRFAAAYCMVFSYLGSQADYQMVLGDSGLAFIFQADALHKPHGADVDQLDIGWWPLDSWGAQLRLQFLGDVYGIPLRILPTIYSEYQDDAARHYRTFHETEVIDSLFAGRPVIGVWGYDIHLVVGCDGGNPPLLGQYSCLDTLDVQRLEHFPYELLVPGDTRQREERHKVDAQALAFAVALGRDEVELTHLPGKSSGKRSWTLWAEQLADEWLCGPHFFHANVMGHLLHRRQEAAGYLCTMSARVPPAVGDLLHRAADNYEEVIATLQRANISEAALRTADGRSRVVELIHTASNLEEQALDAMARAAEML